MADTTDPEKGITVKYVRSLGATTLWLMPSFPNNAQWNIPHECDNLGSPYAVRDYMHISGMIDADCTAQERDETSEKPCWGTEKFKKLIAAAHKEGLKVWLDLAFNHFGHNYRMYDYAEFTPVADMVKDGKDLNALWDFERTYDARLLKPTILDDAQALASLARSGPHKADFDAFSAHCGDKLPKGHGLVPAFHAWRNALKHERAKFPCDAAFLEAHVPGFYMGRGGEPSRGVGDNLTNNWVDVKFLYHREGAAAHEHTFVRNREYLFRVMNYWASLGVDGFRLDHTTEEVPAARHPRSPGNEGRPVPERSGAAGQLLFENARP